MPSNGLTVLFRHFRAHGDQALIAKALGMSAPQFSRYVTGKQRSPNLGTVEGWAKAWDVSVDTVWRLVDDPEAATEFYVAHCERLLSRCSPPPEKGILPLLDGVDLGEITPEERELVLALRRLVPTLAPTPEPATPAPAYLHGRCNFVAGILTGVCAAKGIKNPPGLTVERAEELKRGADFLLEGELVAIAQFTGISIEALRSACAGEGCPVFPDHPSRRVNISV